MKISLKYGLLIAAGLIAWVLLMHVWVPNPQSIVHQLGGPIFSNFLHFVMIYLGIKALEREQGERPTFKDGLKTGVAISFIYGLVASLFFIGVLTVVGTKWLAIEPSAGSAPATRVVAGAFVGLFLGSIFLGLIYSTVISFFLARRSSGAEGSLN